MFIGGLSASTTIEDVRQYFEQFGKVSLLSVSSIVSTYANGYYF